MASRRQASMHWSEAGVRRPCRGSLKMGAFGDVEIWLLTHRCRSDAESVLRRSSPTIPANLRQQLETARLDLLAVLRALDRMDLTATWCQVETPKTVKHPVNHNCIEGSPVPLYILRRSPNLYPFPLPPTFFLFAANSFRSTWALLPQGIPTLIIKKF